jgi:hypothetical protein
MDFQLTNVADLAYEAYVKVVLPAIDVQQRSDPESSGSLGGWGTFPVYQESHDFDGKLERVYRTATHRGRAKAFWINAVGHALIDKIQYNIGNQPIDALTSQYMYMWEELAGKPGKRLGEMIGKYDTIDECISASSMDKQLYIPVPFTWANLFNATSNLPMVALQFHSVRLTLNAANIDRLIAVALPCDIAPRKATTDADYSVNADPYRKEFYRVILKKDGCHITPNAPLDMIMNIGYAYLDKEERDLITEMEFQDLQIHLQTQTSDFSANSSKLTTALDFNHPVSELIWAVQRQETVEVGDYFNFSARDGRAEPIDSVSLKLNNGTRFNREGEYFRMQRNHATHTNLPENRFIYSYSFANEPEKLDPSGTLNFSRIDNTTFTINLNKAEYNRAFDGEADGSGQGWRMYVYARSYNVLNVQSGLGGLLYAN